MLKYNTFSNITDISIRPITLVFYIIVFRFRFSLADINSSICIFNPDLKKTFF